MSAQLNIRVGTPNGTADDGLIQNFRSGFVSFCPTARGGDESFGFASHPPSVPVRDRDIARMSEAAQTGDPMREPVMQTACGEQVLNRIHGTDRNFPSRGREGVHLAPEMNRVPKFALSNLAKPFVPFA